MDRKITCLIVALIAIIVVSIGAVSASDILLDDDSSSIGVEGDFGSDSIGVDGESESDPNGSGGSDGSELDTVTEVTNSSSSNTKTFDDVQKLIDNAKSNDTVKLNGLYVGSGKEIKINKNIIIIGTNNTVLDAKGASRIFNIHANDVVIKNIKFINAFYGMNDDEMDGFGNGGAIFCNGKKLTVSNCCFTNNIVNSSGAAIYHQNAKFIYEDVGMYSVEYKFTESSITNCNFTDNKLSIDVFDAIVDFGNEKGVSKIKNCIFSKNTGYSVKTSNATITNSKFLNNRGAAVYVSYVYTSSAKALKKYSVLIKNCTFKNNYNPDKFNGVIFNELVCSIVDCSFKNNTFNKTAAVVNQKLLTITKNKKKSTFNDSSFYTAHVFDDSLKASPMIMIKANKITANYKATKYFTVKIYNTLSKKPIKATVDLRIFTGKKYKTYRRHTNKSGILKFKTSSLVAGKHKVIVYYMEEADYHFFTAKKATSYISIKKLATTVKAPKVKFKRGKTRYFKVSVKLKSNKKPVKSLKLKLRIYTGKKYKTYKVKTNKKGIAKFNTKKLRWGKHKVLILSGNNNYKVSGKTSIRIK